jgi:DNA-binding beta-propeller fold protein YncE
VIDGRHCNGADTCGCAAQTSATVPTVAVGNQIAFGITAPTVDSTPDRLAVDDLNHTLYVTNAGDDTVSVIDTTHCHADDTSQCASLQPPTVPLPEAIAPVAIAVDPATNTTYVTDNPFPQTPDAVSLIDTTHCRAGDTSQCASQTPPSIPIPSGGAFKIQVDRATNNVYVANLNDSSISVIDGRHCTPPTRATAATSRTSRSAATQATSLSTKPTTAHTCPTSTTTHASSACSACPEHRPLRQPKQVRAPCETEPCCPPISGTWR